jgi:hypothetical protein
MRSPNLFVVLTVVVSAASACADQPAENVAATPPAVVLRGTSVPGEPWTSAPLPVYPEASEASYFLPYPYYFTGHHFVVPRHKHAGASHHRHK